MSIDSAHAGGSPDASPAATAVVSPAPPGWPWRWAALFLVGAAQLITISALVGADPVPATWSSLLLAVAPAPLAAAAAFAPTPVNPLAAVAGIAILVVGIVARVGQYYGRFMMRPKPGSRPSLRARLVAVTLAEQAGRVLAAGAPTTSTG